MPWLTSTPSWLRPALLSPRSSAASWTSTTASLSRRSGGSAGSRGQRHHGGLLSRDSEASRQRAGAARRGAAVAKRHREQTGGSGAHPGVRAKARRWCLSPIRSPSGKHPSHNIQQSGVVLWCMRCGAYATQRGAGLAAPCPGRVLPSQAGGRAQQLRFLKRGIHPKTGQRLLPPRPWCTRPEAPVNRDPSVPAGMALRGDEAALSRTRFGQLRLRVRKREAERLRAGAAPADDGRPAELAPSAAPVPLAPRIAAGVRGQVSRTPHPALARSALPPLACRPPLRTGSVLGPAVARPSLSESSCLVAPPPPKRVRLRQKTPDWRYRPPSSPACDLARPPGYSVDSTALHSSDPSADL